MNISAAIIGLLAALAKALPSVLDAWQRIGLRRISAKTDSDKNKKDTRNEEAIKAARNDPPAGV